VGGGVGGCGGGVCGWRVVWCGGGFVWYVHVLHVLCKGVHMKKL